MVKVGIVGVGYEIGIAQQHIMAYQLMDDAVITAVYDAQEGRAQEYITRFGLSEAIACTSYKALLEQVDAVNICTPNDSHVTLTRQAMEAGRHVLCEKPFAPSAQECEELVALAKKSEVVSLIGLCYRGIPAYRMLKNMVERGELGEIYYTRQSMGGGRIGNPKVELEWRMQRARSGPGAAADFGSHMLDLNDWILQEQWGTLSEFSAMTGCYIKTRARQDNGAMDAVTNDDVAQFIAKTTKGILCSFNASRIGAEHTFEIFGSNGSVAFTGNPFVLKRTTMTAQGPQTVDVPADEACYCGAPEAARKPFLINFYHEMREFLDLIQHGGSTEIDLPRGMYIQQLIDAVDQSAQRGAIVQVGGAQA